VEWGEVVGDRKGSGGGEAGEEDAGADWEVCGKEGWGGGACCGTGYEGYSESVSDRRAVRSRDWIYWVEDAGSLDGLEDCGQGTIYYPEERQAPRLSIWW